jgi:hypothetical protein
MAGQILRTGVGQLLDEYGLDWWDLTRLLVHSALETIIALRRLIADCDLDGDLYATRLEFPITALSAMLAREIHMFAYPGPPRFGSQAIRYGRALRRLTPAQLLEVFWDKYDPGYRWRSAIAPSVRQAEKEVVLVPTAYTNVSRTASRYARILPEQNFLFVTTRNSGQQLIPSANVNVVPLAAYAHNHDSGTEALLQGWRTLCNQLHQIPELRLLAKIGEFSGFERWLSAGPLVRDAWRAVLGKEPVVAVLCGDDSNWYTRLPVLLARKQKIPTIDFHHGAFDGRFLLKDLSSDFYLAKNEMERDYLTRVCGLPSERIVVPTLNHTSSRPLRTNAAAASRIVYFSEPYESQGGRPQEVYQELLPALAELARKQGRELVVKLHPFENARERKRFVESALGRDQAKTVRIVTGPLSRDLLDSTCFGITVESSTVLDCARHGVPCFLCEWLVVSGFGYVQQFDRFGIGRLLHSLAELNEIPRLLAEWDYASGATLDNDEASTAETLRRLLKSQPVSASE